MKALICGGRDFSDRQTMYSTLGIIQTLEGLFSEVIHGGAKGADTIAGNWAEATGLMTTVFPADWERYGKGAGPIRNQQMLDEGQPDLVVAYPTGLLSLSRGTRNMVTKAIIERVPLLVVQEGIICTYDGIRLNPTATLGV